MITKNNIQIFYFGSPGDGFMALPNRFYNEISAFDRSDKKLGELDSYYLKKSNYVDVIYVLYGLGGEGDNSYRRGRIFGVGIRLEGVEIKEKDRNLLFDFLHRFIYEGINQPKAGIFKENDGTITEYAISSFRQKADILEQLAQNVASQFLIEFVNSGTPMTNNKNVKIDLDPENIKRKQEEANRKADHERKQKEYEKKKLQQDTARKNNILNVHSKPQSSASEIADVSNEKSIEFLSKKVSIGHLIIPLLVLMFFSGFTYWKLNKIGDQVKKLTIKIDEIEITDSSKKEIVEEIIPVLIVEIKDGKKQWYFNPQSISEMKIEGKSPSIKSYDEYLDFLVGFIMSSGELPNTLVKEELKKKIVELNNKDIPGLKGDVNSKLKSQATKGVFFSDISLPIQFLIYQE